MDCHLYHYCHHYYKMHWRLKWLGGSFFASLVAQYLHYKIQIEHVLDWVPDKTVSASQKMCFYQHLTDMILYPNDIFFLSTAFKGLNTATSSGFKAWEKFAGKHTFSMLFSMAASTVLKVKWLSGPSQITRSGFWSWATKGVNFPLTNFQIHVQASIHLEKKGIGNQLDLICPGAIQLLSFMYYT